MAGFATEFYEELRVRSKQINKTSRGKRRLLLAALMAGGLACTWHLHHTAITRGDWLRALTGSGDPQRAPTTAGPRRVVAEGRLVLRPGAEVTLGAEIAGRIVRLSVEEKTTVRRGDLIAEIDCDEQRAAVAEAEAKITEIDADLR